jgi:hypothetical protein
MPPQALEPGKRESPMIPPSWCISDGAATACGPSPFAVLRALSRALVAPSPNADLGQAGKPRGPEVRAQRRIWERGKAHSIASMPAGGRFDLPRMSFNWVCIGSGALTSG